MTVREPRSIDHVVHVGHDFDQLAGEYEALGFTVTLRADHPFGTSNRLAVLENAYLELVAITRPELITGEFATAVQRFLRSGPGLATRGLRLSGLVIAGSKPFHQSILGIDVTGSVGDDPSGTGS